MLEKLIKTYNQGRMNFIEKLSDDDFIQQEIKFFDEGRIEVGINVLKKDYEKLNKEIIFLNNPYTEDSNREEKLQYLFNRQHEIIITMVFLASQNFNNIDSCIRFFADMNDDFMFCLEGLKLYSEGNTRGAYEKLNGYLKKHKGFMKHYLLNKIYGKMLYDYGDRLNAYTYIYLASQERPEDAELHRLLGYMYRESGNFAGEFIENSVLKVLEGSK